MLRIRTAKVQDVKQIQKIIECYANNKEMLHRSLNSIYENIQEYVVVEIKIRLSLVVHCMLVGKILQKLKL